MSFCQSNVILVIWSSFKEWLEKILSGAVSLKRHYLIDLFWVVPISFSHWDDQKRGEWERFSNQGQSLRFFSWGPLDQWDASILSSRPIGSLDFGSQNFDLNLKTGHSDIFSSFYAHSIKEWLKKILSGAVSLKRHYLIDFFWVILIHLNVILSKNDSKRFYQVLSL